MFGHSVWRTVGSFGCRRVNLGFARSPARLKVAFTILNVRRPILSVGSLMKHGHGVIFDRANPYLLLRDESTNAVHRVPVEARGNTFVVLGRSVSSMLAPVIKERVAVPAMPAMPVLPGGPHEDRAVLEQVLDDQPVELAEEGARVLRIRIDRTRKQLNVTTLRIFQQLCMVRHLCTVPWMGSSSSGSRSCQDRCSTSCDRNGLCGTGQVESATRQRQSIGCH